MRVRALRGESTYRWLALVAGGLLVVGAALVARGVIGGDLIGGVADQWREFRGRPGDLLTDAQQLHEALGGRRGRRLRGVDGDEGPREEKRGDLQQG